MFASLFVVVLGLCFCGNEGSQSILGVPQLFSPSEVWVKQVAEVQCKLHTSPAGEIILLKLIRRGNPDKILGESTSLNGEAGNFNLVINLAYDGNLECVASGQNNSKIVPTVSKPHYLKVIERVEGARIEVRSGPVEFFEGKTLELVCNHTAGSYVSYKWLLNGRPVSQSALHDNRVFINRTTSTDSGFYMCLASNQYNQTEFSASNSSEVEITVKVVVSKPNISFSVLKEDSRRYSAVVTCQSTRGTTPVTFSLHNETGLVDYKTADERHADFKFPLVLGQHMGSFRCHANNGDQIAYSEKIPISVVPVSGPVTISYDHDTGKNYAVVSLSLYCAAANGSLPRYQWFLNNTLLPSRGSFYYVVDQPPERSVLHLSVGTASDGTYHCEVSDSFDSTTAIRSKKQYITKDELNRLRAFLVAVVFGSFIFLILLVSVCCLIGVLFRRVRYEERPLLGLEMERKVAVDDGELSLSGYSEDSDVVNAARGGGFDQASLVSEDEWPQIEKEKKTLEDEAVEEL